MKKLLIGLIAGLAMNFTSTAHAQVSVNINIGAQPAWGPVGYDYAEYYYLPDIETYYYVPRRQFIYMSNGQWIFSTSLPSRYRSYDLYNGYKVVVNEPRAYRYFSNHKVKYAKYKGNNGKQKAIRYSTAPKNYKANGSSGNSKGSSGKSGYSNAGSKNNGQGNSSKSHSGSNGKGNGKSKGKH